MKKKILSLMLIFCLTLVPALCISASADSTTTDYGKTHMVDLTSAFNRDIFANVGDVVDSNWGFKEKVGLDPVVNLDNQTLLEHTGLNLTNIVSSLKNGILFSDSKTNIISKDNLSTQEDVHSYVSATPFDLSKVSGNQNNAIVFEDNVYVEGSKETITVEQNANGTVFSGKPSKYLLVLSVVGRGNSISDYTLTYTDGTKSTLNVSYSWSGVYESNCALNAGQRVYVAKASTDNKVLGANKGNWASGSHPFANTSVLVVSAIPTNGNTIKSVSNNYITAYGPMSILAMTEVLLNDADMKAQFESEIDELTTTTSTLDNITDSESYLKAKKAVASAEHLTGLGIALDSNVTSKVEKYKKQLSVFTHMVDLSSYFNRDIFAKVGETVGSDWGFGDFISYDTGNRNSKLEHTGLDLDIVKSALSDGVISDGTVAKVVENAAGNLATNNDIAVAGITETPFDLSHIEENKNAIVHDAGFVTSTSVNGEVTIEKNAFSGNPVDYLLVLGSMGKSTAGATYTVTYTDGTTSTHKISYSWSAVYEKSCVLNAKERLYVDNATNKIVKSMYANSWTNWHPWENQTVLVVSAIPTNGKTISRVKKSGDAWNGATPILAMTEVTKVTALNDKEAELETTLNAMVSDDNSNGDIITLQDQENAKKAIELATYLENGGYELSAETKAKIEKLSKQYNGVKPYMVDLSNSFNRDIFANVGETVDSTWGYKEKLADGSKNENSSYNQFVKTIGINLDTVKGALNSEGVLSSDKVAPVVAYKNATLATDEVVRNYALSTPFDLSHIEEGKNAIVHDASCYETVVNTTVEIEKNAKGENVFSGKPSKYLAVLSSVSNGTQIEFYTITFTDGTTEEFKIEYPWTGNFDTSQYTLNVGPNVSVDENGKVVASKEYNYNQLNRNVLLTSVIPTNGKTIKSISNKAHALYGVTPVLAMTEIPANFDTLFETAEMFFGDSLPTVTKDNAAAVINASVATIELCDRGYLDDNELYNKAVNLNKQAQSVLKFGDKEFYVENTFEEKDGKVRANVTLANTSADNTTYVLIIGAYSDNGQKLEDYKCSETKNFNVTGNEINDSIELPINDKATSYKLFVWKSLDSLSPIATFVK